MNESIISYFPAFSILFVMITVIFLIVLRLPHFDLVNMLDQRGFIVIATFSIFSLTLSLHLFQNQEWTADILKVIIGVVVGVTASFKSKDSTQVGGTDVNVKGSEFGDFTKIAGHDINETLQKIDKLDGDVHEIKNSVIHQHQYIEQVAKFADALPPPGNKTDYLFVVAPNGTDAMLSGQAQKIISKWSDRSWRFDSLAHGTGPSWIYIFVKKAEGNPEVRVEEFKMIKS
jgi:hypothetical protein